MKSYPIHTPFYAGLPAVWIEGDDLFLKPHFLRDALNAFATSGMVRFNRKRRIASARTKKWWKWAPARHIPFDRIAYFDLTYPRVAEHEKDTPDDVYALFLITASPFSRIDLIRFDSPAGGNKEMADRCVALIGEFTGIRFGTRDLDDRPSGAFGDAYICTACGHRLPPTAETVRCPYCGGGEIRIV